MSTVSEWVDARRGRLRVHRENREIFSMVMSDPDLANVDPGCDASYRDLFRTESPGMGDEDAAEWFAMLSSLQPRI